MIQNKIHAALILCASLAAAAATSACGGLSSREKELVGKYYIPAVSDSKPLIELNGDRSSVVRAIKPGELAYSVGGTWKVNGDTLVIEPDPTSITIEEGDPALIGTVSPRIAYPIQAFNESVLSVKKQGIIYDYHRRAD